MGAAARCGGVCFLLTLMRITGDDELANPVFVDYVPRQRRARRDGGVRGLEHGLETKRNEVRIVRK